MPGRHELMPRLMKWHRAPKALFLRGDRASNGDDGHRSPARHDAGAIYHKQQEYQKYRRAGEPRCGMTLSKPASIAPAMGDMAPPVFATAWRKIFSRRAGGYYAGMAAITANADFAAKLTLLIAAWSRHRQKFSHHYLPPTQASKCSAHLSIDRSTKRQSPTIFVEYRSRDEISAKHG